MKICILSMQRVNNYGSVLQAYALKKIIEEFGHQVEFIDIKRGENETLNIQCDNLTLDKKDDKNWLALQMLRIKYKFSNLRAKRMFDFFRMTELGIDCKKVDDFIYDVGVIGSDEVFNCLQKSKWGFAPQLFGEVTNSKSVITYAASCGATTEAALSEDLRAAIISAMSNLNAISVRDENTASFVRTLTGREPQYNLDPVAIGDFTKEIQSIDLNNKVPSRYCLVYSYEGRISEGKTIKAILNFCENHNLVPIAPFGKQKWIQSQSVLAPFEILKAFENAECVITDTFHGTLFGAKFGKKMAVIIRESNRNKLMDLTFRLKIEDHVLQDINELENVLNKNLDRPEIDKILARERERSITYLRENLN